MKDRMAILCYHFADRIKSEMLIASRLLDALTGCKDEERKGALMISGVFLEALLGEIAIALNITKVREFEEAGKIIGNLLERIKASRLIEIEGSLARAISRITVSQRNMELLIKEGLL